VDFVGGGRERRWKGVEERGREGERGKGGMGGGGGWGYK